MAKRRRIFEGKGKILYEGPESRTLIQHFKDRTAPGDNPAVEGKGVLNNRISEYLFTILNHAGFPTHFLRRINMREQLVRSLDIIPLELVVRNLAAGSICRRLGLEEGIRLPRAIVEYRYKSDALGDPLVSEEHIAAFGWASAPEFDEMTTLAVRVNDVLTGLFAAAGFQLVDMKLEFGRLYEDESPQILIADEISPDTCRLWEIGSDVKGEAGKVAMRASHGEAIGVYHEVARRLGVITAGEAIRGRRLTTPTIVR